MSDVEVDFVVIGAGLMGATTAWELSRRGRSVAVVEAFDVGHHHGSSHGSSRIFRRAYADPHYVSMTGLAADLWREFEVDTGCAVLRRTGGLDHGDRRDPGTLHHVLTSAGVACEYLTVEAASHRWPQSRFAGPVLYHPEAGVIDADAAVAAATRRAVALGARLISGTRVSRVANVNAATIVHTDGPILRARGVIAAPGAWLPELAGRLGVPLGLPPLRVTQQQVFHFRQHDPRARWPIFVHKGRMEVFGLPSGSDGGPLPAMKVARHDAGTPTTASGRTGVVDPAVRDDVVRYVREWLPGLEPVVVNEATCLYTWTPDEDFVVDRVGALTVLSPCSGHGAKFAPLIARWAADLATGARDVPPRFAGRSPQRCRRWDGVRA